MANVRRTAMGEAVDMDMLRLSNEEIIAIGNMRTNARGDELGQGGKIVKTRAQIMSEYHKLNTPVADDRPPQATETVTKPVQLLQPTAQDTPVVVEEETAPAETTYVKPRGSFAESVAEQTEVTQELLDPTKVLGTKPTGIQRI